MVWESDWRHPPPILYTVNNRYVHRSTEHCGLTFLATRQLPTKLFSEIPLSKKFLIRLISSHLGVLLGTGSLSLPVSWSALGTCVVVVVVGVVFNWDITVVDSANMFWIAFSWGLSQSADLSWFVSSPILSTTSLNSIIVSGVVVGGGDVVIIMSTFFWRPQKVLFMGSTCFTFLFSQMFRLISLNLRLYQIPIGD